MQLHRTPYFALPIPILPIHILPVPILPIAILPVSRMFMVAAVFMVVFVVQAVQAGVLLFGEALGGFGVGAHAGGRIAGLKEVWAEALGSVCRGVMEGFHSIVVVEMRRCMGGFVTGV